MTGTPFETRTVGAMTPRGGLWLAVAWMPRRRSRKSARG